METLNGIYFISSFLLMVIGVVMVLRRAFSESMWWGLACILFPIAIPFFVITKWQETKKGFTILSVGAVIYSGIYFANVSKVNRAIEEMKIVKITITNALDSSNAPVSELGQISINEKKVYTHVRMQLQPKIYYRFTGQIYDAGGKLLMNYTMPMVPTTSVWNAWFYHDFDKSVDASGEWKFVFLANDKKLAEQRFDVTN